MQISPGRQIRIALAVAVVVALACTGLAAAAPLGSGAATGGRPYTVTISPRYTTAGQPTTFTVTFRNISSVNTMLRSGELAPPTGFRLQRLAAPFTHRGTATVRNNMLALRSTLIRPGAIEQVHVTAIAPLGGCANPNATTPNGNGAPVRWRSAMFAGAAPSGPSLKPKAAGSTLTTTEVCAMQAPCGDGGPACSVTVNTNVSSYTAVSNAGAGTLLGGLDVGRHLRCAGYRPRDPNWYESILTGSAAAVTFQIKYTLRNTNPSQIHVCFGLPYEFTTASGNQAASRLLPNGNAGFIGLLPPCTPGFNGPCVVSITPTPDQNSNTGFDANVTVQVPTITPAGTPAGDPWMGP